MLGPGTASWVQVGPRLRASLGERFRLAVLAAENGDLRALRSIAAHEPWDFWGGLPADLAEMLAAAVERVPAGHPDADAWAGLLRMLILRRALRVSQQLGAGTVRDVCVRLAAWTRVDPSRHRTAACPRGRRPTR